MTYLPGDSPVLNLVQSRSLNTNCSKFGGMSLGRKVCGYLFVNDDEKVLPNLESQVHHPKADFMCKGDKNEGVHIFYANSKKFFLPIEVLIKCDGFQNATHKNKALKQFVKKFEQNDSPNSIHKHATLQTDYGCKTEYNRLVPRTYSDGMCQFEYMIYYNNAKVVGSMENWELKTLKSFSRDLDDRLKNSFSTPWNNVVKTGCYNEAFTKRPNSCHILSETKYYDENNSRMTETLYRIQCCCRDAMKCAKVKTTRRDFMCPYDIRRFVISGFSITQENNTFENVRSVEDIRISNECLFKLIIRRNITEIERVKSNATIDVEYGVKDCNFDRIYADDVCQDQRNFSIIEEFDMNQIMCCRSMFYLNNSTKDIDPIKRLASKVNSVLFQKDPNQATGKISRILEYGMHNCVYYYKPSRCYFHYHNKTKKVLTVNEDINFVNVHANASTYDDIILYRASTKPVNQTKKIRPKQCFCFNIGGCETNDVGYVCNSIENTFLHCSCVVQPKYYADYRMFLELKSGKNISYGDIYMPYCKEKQKNGTAIAKTSSDSFFCYESYTPPHGWNRVFIRNNSITEMGFYNDSSKNAPIKFSDCLNPESQCKWDKTGRYICCCRALYAESEPLPVIFCNNGSLLERFIISETWQNPKQFIASAQDRQLCDDAINDDVSVWDSDSLSNEMNPLCYFSMKFSNKSFNLNDVKSVHYSSSNMTRGDNIGVFSLLCQVKTWTPLENTKGCACRLIEPLLQKHRRKKIASELSCCCIARFANNFKQLAMDIVNKRTRPYKSQKIK